MAEADVKVAPSCNDVPSNLSDVGAQAKTPQTKFAVLKTLIEASDRGNVEVSDRDIVDTVFNLLVGGEFDLEVNFIIQDENCIIYMLDIMSVCSMQCQAEIWSKFKGICRKSYRNLQACVDVGLTQKLLTILPDACEIMSELIVDMLSILTSYNITVKELKQLLSMLKGEHGRWPSHATKLLGVLQATTERQGPDCFFSFPGRQDAAIALPPLKTWPYANGFTFTTWFRMDPLNSLRSDMDKPYLYCFRNSKGMGYSGHFVGNCFIVTVLKAKGKGFQHCLKFEFKPRKWYMVTIVHIYNRWRTSEVKCYANGQLVSYSEMNWSIGGNDQYDRCFLGSAETGDDSRVFCGQMTASYVFSEALSASQVYALHQLGPAYKNQFKFPTESDHLLVNHHRKVLYDDNKLSDAIVLSYNPKSTDGQLCLESSPRSHTKDSTDSQRWFVHNPHALMLHDVRAVVTHSIHSALHSVGGAEVLFPLFAQLDYKQSDGSLETTVCATLLNFFLQLLQGSVKTQQQVLQGKGFLVIGTLLERAHKDHISMDVLTALITMAKFLDQLPNSVPLMRQFCDHILFNPALWIYTKTKIQICLYTFLATEFVSSPTIQTNLRRVSTVILLIHALKYYYWVVNPQNRSGIVPKGLAGPRPSAEEILSLRAFILLFLKQLVTRTGSIADDELQSILGYLLTMHEDDNILDVLQLLVAMLSEHGTMVTPVFDKQNGLAVVYKLLGSRSVLVRIHTLKLLAYFLKQCSEKRKSEIMESQSLFMLIGERLLLYPDEIDIPTYNAMYEILVENPCTQVLQKPHQEPSPTTFIQNPAMMKVTANMFRQCPSSSTLEVKLVFLNDLVSLFQANAENRRTLLQQSVWQDWMLSLGYLRPRGSEEYKCQELVYQLFRILLYHSIKLEWGGWRVWVDTLAIVHSKVSYEEHKAYLEQMYDEYKKSEQHRKETGHVSAITGMQKTTHTKPTVPSQELAIEASDSQGDASEMAPIGAGEVLTISEAKYGDEDHLVVTVNDHDEQPASEDQAKDSKSASANEESSEKEDDSVNEKLDARSNAKEDIGDHPVMTEDGETPNDKDTGVDDEKVPEDVDQVTGQETEQQNEDGGVTASNKDETETQSDTGEVVEEDRITKVATEDQEKIDVGDENIHKEDPVKDEDTVKDAVETNTAGDLAEQTQDLEDEDKIDVGDENIHKDPVKDEDTSKDAVETNTAGELAEQTQDLADEDKSVAEECTKSDEKEAETEPDVGDVVSEKEAEEGNDLIKNADDENHTEEKSDEEEKINENQHEKAEESVHENEVVQKDENSPDYKEIEKVHVKEDEFEKEVVDSRNESDEEDIKAEGDETRDAAVEKEVKGFEDKSLNASTKDEDDVSIEASHGSTPSAGDIAGGSAEEIPKHAEKEKDGSDSSQEDQVSDTVGPDGVVLEDVKAEGAVPTKDADKATNSQNAIQEATQESSKDADAAAISPSGSTQVEKNDAKNQSTEEPRQQFSPGPRTVVFRVPEFKWSDVHLRLLDDLFARLEEDIESWRSTKKPFVDVVNGSENVIFLHNTLHLFSQMIDNIILACGGILPILSSATSQNTKPRFIRTLLIGDVSLLNFLKRLLQTVFPFEGSVSVEYELDCIESSHGLSMESAWNILNRLSAFVDVVAFASNVNFADIEADKNMQSGGLLRQCLRAACLCAVRNCLESRYLRRNASVPSTPNVVNTTQEVGASNGVSEADEDEDENADVLAVDAAKVLLSFMSNKATPILDPLTLLQDADVGRLKAIIYRDMDDTTSSQYIALSVVYFVSVLMVSKYRDLLDPDSLKKLQQATVARRLSPRRRMIDRGARFPSKSKPADDFEDAVPMATDTMTNGHASPDKKVDVAIEKPADIQNTEVSLDSEKPTSSSVQVASVPSTYHSFDRSVVVKSKNDEEATGSQLPSTIASSSTPLPSSTEVQEEALGAVTNGDIDHTDLPTFDPSTVNILEDNEADISSRLERSMDELAPLLRDIFLDFSSYLSKTLVGSHGQELLVEGLVCMRSYTSVVELVMLLCSQEWQTSIQKNAGLAFIELINEGRLLCHGMKDHVVKVANEADFILSKQRAEDVKKHAHFESSSAIYFAQQRDEQRQCDALISAAKHRDHAAAQALKNRITNILTNKLGAWGSTFNSRSHEYWMLDAWEDDTRRRRRFVRNPYGSSHKDAVLAVSKDLNPVLDAATPGTIPKSPSSFSVQGIDQYQPTDEELSQEEIDLDELQGPVSFSTEADLIAPGASLHGVFSISSDEFFFEVVEQHPGFAKVNPKVLAYTDGVHGKWLFQEVRGVYSRRYLLNNSALEIFLANRTCVMFNFADNETMKKVVAYLPAVGIGTGYGLSQERRVSLVSPRQLLRSSNMTERWQRREISNFEYLMFLNTIAGRTFNDLNQYPVFPWVLSNYDVAELDLSLPSNYRDLSKPVGALNPKRAAYFQSRYENWDDPSIPKFHYGTHYSNAAFTLGWLVRVEPFTTMFLALQGGKFDHADRTFHSVLQSWKNCQRDSHDVKELIPEFFYLPEMFINSNNYNLGATSEGIKINDVILPPWAKSADDFVQMNRLALESEIVSCQIHQWIDLIFGFKQRGPEATRATNVFYHLTYENSVNLDKIKDPVERAGIREQIKNFGQTPSQLLVAPHPPRSSAMHMTPMMFKENEVQDVIMVLKFLSNSPVMCVAANTHANLQTPAVVTCTKNLQFCVNKWNEVPDTKPSSTSGGEETSQPLPIEPDPQIKTSGGACKRQISDLLDQSVKVQSSCFVVTADNRFLATCGYWDRSFRVTHMDSGRLNQVVFGHWDVVTCLTRSDTYIGGDCYFVSGSRDATLMLWYWSGRRNLIIGDSTSADENPSPRAVLTGHDTEITCAAVCAEVGLIASGSLEGPILLHTITGDLLRSLEPSHPSSDDVVSTPRPELIEFTGEGMVIASYDNGLICNFTMNGRSMKSKVVEDNVRAMLSSKNSQFLVTGGDKGIMQVWSAWDFKLLYTYPQCDAGIRDIALSHDEKVVITGMTSGSIVAFRINFNKWHHEYQDKY